MSIPNPILVKMDNLHKLKKKWLGLKEKKDSLIAKHDEIKGAMDAAKTEFDALSAEVEADIKALPLKYKCGGKKMGPDQALKIIEGVVDQLKLTKKERMTLDGAIAVLNQMTLDYKKLKEGDNASSQSE